MKKLTVLCILFLCASCFSEETAENYVRTIIEQPSEQLTRLPLVRNTARFTNTSGYEFLDGEQLSFGSFKSIMYGYPDSKRYMKKAEFWRIMTIVGGALFLGTFCAALSSESDVVSSVCTLSSMGALGLSAAMGYSTLYHKAKAADYYNMHIIDEELDYLKHKAALIDSTGK